MTHILERIDRQVEEFCDLEEAIWYDLYLHPEPSNYGSVADGLAEVTGLYIQGNRGMNRKHIIHLLGNLVKLYQCYPDGYVKIHLGSGYWSSFKHSNVNPLGISRKVVDIINRLHEKDYIEKHNGFYDRFSGRGRVTRLKYTDKLLKEFIEPSGIAEKPVRLHHLYPFVRVNEKIDSSSAYIRPEDSEKLTSMTATLETYNELLAASNVRLNGFRNKLSGGLGDFTVAQPVYRVFNDRDLLTGGRFYGAWWLNCPRRGRPLITINGENTVELDYSAQHPYLIYGLKTERHYTDFHDDGDPYYLEMESGKPYPRALIKLFVLTAFNAKNFNEAFKGLRQKISDSGYKHADQAALHPFGGRDFDNKMDKAEEHELFLHIIRNRDTAYKELFDKFCSKYSQVREHICSGIGKELQYWDSQIAEYIIQTLTSEEIVCLCIHDSFIVQERHKERLVRIMNDAYINLNLQYSLPPIGE